MEGFLQTGSSSSGWRSLNTLASSEAIFSLTEGELIKLTGPNLNRHFGQA
jgi:hypothetical protein